MPHIKTLFTILIISLLAALSVTAQTSQLVILRGSVTDAKTGEPIAKVKIIVIGGDLSTTTDDKGEFTLRLEPGEVELYVTTIGYGLVKKKAVIKENEEASLRIALNQEAAPLLDEVTVTAGPFEQTETNVASEQTLNKSELSALSMVLTSDPTRAAQALPGVVGNDDFRSDFTLRGAGFNRIGFYIDGLLLPDNPAHTMFSDNNSGSISILNADALASVTLLSGAYPARFGDSTAGVLNLETRGGNRVKPSGRIAASLLSSSALFDGPFADKRGAWLVTARKSYLNYVLNRLREDEDEDNLIINFTDAQGKAVYDLTPHNQIGFTAIVGKSDFDTSRPRSEFDISQIFSSNSRIHLVYGNWNYNPGARLSAQTQVFSLSGSFTDENPDELALEDGTRAETGLRSDLKLLAHPDHRVEAGIYVRSVQGDRFKIAILAFPQPQIIPLVSFDRRAVQQGYYLQDTWSSARLRFALTGGIRIDHTGLTGETVATPRVALGLAPREGTMIRLGWGQHAEFPDFSALYGERGNPRLRAERATHYNIAIEHLISSNTRVLAEFYDREDKELIFGLRDLLIAGDGVVFISLPFNNSVRGYARGFEVSLHRRSANRLTGWLSYSYSATRLRDRVTGFSFISDFDQRHTISSYGSYRLTETLNLSAQWRYGSGLPLVGFLQEIGEQLFLASERNRVRLKDYSRVDFRISKSFHFKRSKLTLIGEVLNVLARENVRQDGLSREKLLPFLPSFGVAFEF